MKAIRFASASSRGCRDAAPRGMALLTVLILGLVFSIVGIAVYSLATMEFRQVTYRDDSGSAFWLADAAIEHAKAEIVKDIFWTAGFDSVTRGEGYYDLTMTDSTYDGVDARHFYARGFVPRIQGTGYTERDVEVFAEISPAGFEYAIFSTQTIDFGGNPNICGRVHGNDAVLDENHVDVDDTCGNGAPVSEDFVVIPPVPRTEPQYYPNTTYYYVVGRPASNDSVWVVREDPTGPLIMRTGHNVIWTRTIEAGGGPDIADFVGANRIDYNFKNAVQCTTMFSWTAAGICSLRAGDGDVDVVVNFGEYLQGAAPTMSNIEIDADIVNFPILSTIINTRLIDYPPPDSSAVGLANPLKWEGLNFSMQKITTTPQNGIAFIVHNLYSPGNSLIHIGTPAFPAVFFVTGDVLAWNANGEFYGSLIALGDISMNGGPNFRYNRGYAVNLPPYLNGLWQAGTSGFARILLWREPAPKYT